MPGVEAVGKPQDFEFSRQKVLCFQGSNFSKETFSTASLGAGEARPRHRSEGGNMMQGMLPHMVGAVVLSWVLVGCSIAPQHFGIRPDEPVFTIDRATACQEFVAFAKYTQELQEAYHSRATQNRCWIYASGTTGLGTMAA